MSNEGRDILTPAAPSIRPLRYFSGRHRRIARKRTELAAASCVRYNTFYYGMVSASNAIYIGGYGPAEIDTFTNLNFLSAYLTGAWRSNLNVQVQGFRGGSLLYDTIVVASATNPTLFTFNYLDIDRLSFNTSGGEAAFEHDGGAIVVLDNLSFEFVPEPSSFLLTTVAALMLWPLLRRKRA